jgi:hypothetical protein
MLTAVRQFYITSSLTHSRSWSLLEKPQVVHLLKNFPAFYGTRKFITMSTRTLHWSIFWARSIHTIPHYLTYTSNIPSTKSHIHFLSLRSFIQWIRPGLRLLVIFRNKFIFYGGEFLTPRPTSQLEDHPLSAVSDCLINIFTATLHIWRPLPPSATWGRAMRRWQGHT